MSRKKKSNLPAYCFYDDEYANFAMVSANLFGSDQFQQLSHAARAFYIMLVCHKNTPEQRHCLYNTLKEYYTILGIDKPDIDIQCDAGTYPKAVKESKFFVIPSKQLAQYGYTASRASKLKKELIGAGFIRVVYGKKLRYNAWNQKITVYAFSNKWKQTE